MRIVNLIAAMQRLAQTWRRAGMGIGLVPTMGYLHEGHLSLVRQARRRVGRAGRVVVSIYVNPKQFGPQEDLSRYPRDLHRDLKLCRAEGVDAVFVPDDAEMYAGRDDDALSTYVVEERLSCGMEGVSRPTHFRGVTTVVAKLFNIVLPDVAIFGAKDWQQAAIMKRMVRDLNFPLQIVVSTTVRETDGLAMSSRNHYLSAAEREQATILSRAIAHARAAVRSRPWQPARLKQQIKRLIGSVPLARLDYVEFFDADNLQPATAVKRGTHMALAVFIGRTRLIDNGRL